MTHAKPTTGGRFIRSASGALSTELKAAAEPPTIEAASAEPEQPAAPEPDAEPAAEPAKTRTTKGK